MCNKIDEQIGKIVRNALSEIVELEAEEVQRKLLGFPRYEKIRLFTADTPEITVADRKFRPGFAIIFRDGDFSDIIGVFNYEGVGAHLLEWLNAQLLEYKKGVSEEVAPCSSN